MSGKEGYWRIEYVGRTGDSGFGLVAFDTQEVIGCDVGGGIYTGQFQIVDGGYLDFDVTFKAGEYPIELVQGKKIQAGHSFWIKGRLPRNVTEKTIIDIETEFGPIKARVQKLLSF
ncbi:MAG: hypothetical protein ABF617_08685 [Gluconobacter japonicus]|uniref:hypothetical protein n=1 Tax=Gluconobacter japonicus TaxID=376620 RepID=UPI0039EA5777